jgi:hypothetical protein
MGMGDSAVNYVRGEVINPQLCKLVPDFAKREDLKLSCLHDGLQEWMRADQEFDCEEKLMTSGTSSDQEWARVCDTKKMEGDSPFHPNYSGYTLINKIATNNIRTMLLGHTHYSSLEIYQPGTKLVPDSVVLDEASQERYAQLETVNPIRNYGAGITKEDSLKKPHIMEDSEGFGRLLLKAASHSFRSVLDNHELVIARLTTVADMSSQVFGNDGDYYGFSALEFKKTEKRRASDNIPQLNGIYLYRYVKETKGYELVGGGQHPDWGHLEMDRTKDVRYRKLEQIKRETTGGLKDEASDYKYLCAENYSDDANLWRRVFTLKTEPDDGKESAPFKCD